MAEILVATSDVSGAPKRFRLLASASTNLNVLKVTSGNVYGWYFENNAAYAVFVKLYDKATAVTVGTDVPFLTILVGAGLSSAYHTEMGIPCAAGLALAATKLFADSDTTVLVAGDVQGTLLYK